MTRELEDDGEHAWVLVTPELVHALQFLSHGRGHVRRHWHEAPDASARLVLGLIPQEVIDRVT